MPMYKISLCGLYQYSDTLFDNLEMPTFTIPSDPPAHVFLVDKDTLISIILEKSSDFPVLYPDFDFMKFMIGVWSKNTAYMMQTLYDTINAKYNPMENYDRTSIITREGSNTGTGTSVNSQTSFNSDAFKDTGKTTSNASDTVKETVTDRAHGNIGVRSGQELIQQSRDIAAFKWYDIVAQDFINKFCVQIF